jgi:hypothetical protein
MLMKVLSFELLRRVFVLMMEAVSTSETSVNSDRTERRNKTKDRRLHAESLTQPPEHFDA